jgi:hypothetical protein
MMKNLLLTFKKKLNFKNDEYFIHKSQLKIKIEDGKEKTLQFHCYWKTSHKKV